MNPCDIYTRVSQGPSCSTYVTGLETVSEDHLNGGHASKGSSISIVFLQLRGLIKHCNYRERAPPVSFYLLDISSFPPTPFCLTSTCESFQTCSDLRFILASSHPAAQPNRTPLKTAQGPDLGTPPAARSVHRSQGHIPWNHGDDRTEQLQNGGWVGTELSRMFSAHLFRQ